jgi:NAD(P)-dependent dehydrogenase (short-subunit alcohol dehydrogenase family)
MSILVPHHCVGAPMTARKNGGVAVVTGASGGLGRALVRELAESGYDVGLLARGRAGLDAAAEEVRRCGRRALAVPTDVADWEQVDAAAQRITDELGPIDVWINNAMTTVFATIADTRPEELRRATEVTYFGQVHGTMAALERMRRAMPARSCPSARRWRTGASRCRARTAARSSPCVASWSRCDAS